MEYTGTGTANKVWLISDSRGSITGHASASGTSVATNTYDPYGTPAVNNTGRFQYTGQIWLEEVGLYYYKARYYDPDIRRFITTDPIGYGDGLNMYAYVGGDPMNRRDPSGMESGEIDCDVTPDKCVESTGTRRRSTVAFRTPFGGGGFNFIGTGLQWAGFGGAGGGLLALANKINQKLDDLCGSLKGFAATANTFLEDVPFGPGDLHNTLRTDNPWISIELGGSGGNGLYGGVDVGLFVHQTSGDYGVYFSPSIGIGSGGEGHLSISVSNQPPTGLSVNGVYTAGFFSGSASIGLTGGIGSRIGAGEEGLTGKWEAGLSAGANAAGTVNYGFGKMCGNING